jgi:anti-sigma regulatory factor (Ser/Thr protein kinase)
MNYNLKIRTLVENISSKRNASPRRYSHVCVLNYLLYVFLIRLAVVINDLAKALEGVPDDCANIMMVASDEIFANIVRYSGATDWTLTVERTHHPDGVRLVITDNGKPFDPLSYRDPDTTLCADDMEVGGLGILIVKKTMSPVTYRRNNDRNILTMGKEYGDQN